MLLKRRVVSAVLCAFLALSVTGCANTSTQGILGSSESVNESGESDSPATVVVETRDEQPESSRQWFALSREERREKIREYMRQSMACLEGKGWKVKEVSGGPAEISFSADTQGDPTISAQFMADSEECDKLYPAPDSDTVISVPDIEDDYEYDLTVKECLEKEGITVTAPPTKQKYVDDFRNNRDTWSPYTDLMNATNLTADRLREITEKCPQW
ncbi:hypothetical protein [Schaalia sp. lx-100]|uniref:hypothetical protein n=1 Tax=Schaalia sp. lx-100 TaxID=2899081 RepID=UPI001E47D336|nr:hypothetical protein [Schaalia sp. lx-100]MCD4557968.1 hypothetical protein [Schaalia sp. lx-100]